MFVLPGRSQQIARALAVIEAGERLAHSCVARQLELAVETGADASTRSFLAGQLEQESVHASFFGAGARLFGGAAMPEDAARALEHYSAQLNADLTRGSLTASLIGMQCVFEALGESVLNAFDRSVSPKVKLFAEFRRRITREEATHHAFGLRAVRMRVATDENERACVPTLTEGYAALGHAILRDSLPLFADLGGDCEACVAQYRTMVQASLARAMGDSTWSLQG